MLIQEIKNHSRLRDLYWLLDETVTATNDYAREANFAPDIYARALSGQVKVFEVSPQDEPVGMCFCTTEQGILYINALYLQVEAPKGLMKQVGKELIEFAKSCGMIEVRFKTKRPKGMQRALNEIGFVPACMEFAVVIED